MWVNRMPVILFSRSARSRAANASGSTPAPHDVSSTSTVQPHFFAIVAIRSPKTPVGHARRVSAGPNMLVTAASRLPVPDEPNNNTSPVVAKIDCMRSAMLWSRRAYSGPR